RAGVRVTASDTRTTSISSTPLSCLTFTTFPQPPTRTVIQPGGGRGDFGWRSAVPHEGRRPARQVSATTLEAWKAPPRNDRAVRERRGGASHRCVLPRKDGVS